MTAPIHGRPERGVPAIRVLVIAFVTFTVGVLLTIGAATIHRWITDDSRPNLTLADVIRDDLPGFEHAEAGSADVCGDRPGCVEGIAGEGVSVYRYESLAYARHAITSQEADFYRADRLVFEFTEDVTPAERLRLVWNVEGFGTGTGD